MALYNDNGANVTTFTPAALSYGRFVAYGSKWGGAIETGVTLTFSFPGSGPNTYHTNPYPYSNSGSAGEYSNWFGLSNAEQQAVRSAILVWERYSGVQFNEVSEGSDLYVGELRFAYSATLADTAIAHAYHPYANAAGGDVWFNPDHFNSDRSAIPVGSYDFLTILHETGHAIGLKHTFEGTYKLPADKDNYFHSIMSYTASPFSADGDNYASFYPTTPMFYDLAAIEQIYGVRAHATGNTTYLFKDGFKYWQAIHDTGGTDTIVYQGAENTTIVLLQGAMSSLSEAIQFKRPNNTAVYSKATVTIGPNVVIENATGGSGNDSLIGNVAANMLTGAGGNDTLSGLGGNDRLRGNGGNDTMFGGFGYDAFLFNTAPGSSNHDTIKDYVPAYDNIQLENAVFTKLGAAGYLNPSYFRAAAFALDGNDYIIYHKASGNLFYDADAVGFGARQLIATLTNKPTLTASEFVVV